MIAPISAVTAPRTTNARCTLSAEMLSLNTTQYTRATA